ncbi:unnamed protein product, partial [Plutella xylostella]
PEVSQSAAEAVAQVHTIGPPLQPVEGRVVATPVLAEGQGSGLGVGDVGVVDAHECCAYLAKGAQAVCSCCSCPCKVGLRSQMSSIQEVDIRDVFVGQVLAD